MFTFLTSVAVFTLCFCGREYLVKTRHSLYHLVKIEKGVLRILHFSGEAGHVRHNASPYSGSCGTQTYLQYGPDGDS